MSEQYKIKLINIFKHLHTINKHRFKVFCLSLRVGIFWQGLTHDLSKYSFTEFFESVKYYQGTYSPIRNCKQEKGYSNAWLHHKGRNKHHYEYWYDYDAPDETPVMPFKYFLELVCDNLAAGMTYQGKRWTKEYQLTYWHKVKNKAKMYDNMKNLIENVYQDISKYGLDKVLKKSYLQKLYNKHINGEE